MRINHLLLCVCIVLIGQDLFVFAGKLNNHGMIKLVLDRHLFKRNNIYITLSIYECMLFVCYYRNYINIIICIVHFFSLILYNII